MGHLAGYLERLDTTQSLDCSENLQWDGGRWHFYRSCGKNASRYSHERSVNFLEAIQLGQDCAACWDTANAWVKPVEDLARMSEATGILTHPLEGTPQQALFTLANLRRSLDTITDTAGASWRQELYGDVTQRLETARAQLDHAAKQGALELALDHMTRKGLPTPGDEAKLMSVHYGRLLRNDFLVEITMPYLLTFSRTKFLFQAPSEIAYLAANYLDSNVDHYLPTNMVEAVEAAPPHLLPGVVEMWNPEDPLFGDLKKLVEAAYIIR